jgi:hypothetical protein
MDEAVDMNPVVKDAVAVATYVSRRVFVLYALTTSTRTLGLWHGVVSLRSDGGRGQRCANSTHKNVAEHVSLWYRVDVVKELLLRGRQDRTTDGVAQR